MSAPSKILLKSSAAYSAYTALDALWDDAPKWQIDSTGSPDIKTGELFCRYPSKNEYCGLKCKGTSPLKTHVEKMHLVGKKVKVTSKHGNISGSDLRDLKDFYELLKEGQEYEGRGKTTGGDFKGKRSTVPAKCARKPSPTPSSRKKAAPAKRKCPSKSTKADSEDGDDSEPKIRDRQKQPEIEGIEVKVGDKEIRVSVTIKIA